MKIWKSLFTEALKQKSDDLVPFILAEDILCTTLNVSPWYNFLQQKCIYLMKRDQYFSIMLT